MTVVSSGNAITFAGDGVQTAFDFNFRIFNADDLCAVVRNGDGKQKTLVAGSDFKIISGIGVDSGGKVQYPVSGPPLASGESITLFREIAYTQDLELVDNDPFSAQLLNEAFDRGVMRDQQLQEQVDRALKYDISTPGEDRLSPQELVKTISSARDEAVSARSGAVEAENTACEMLDDAKAALAGSEAARDNALEAKAGAEKARDAAIKISVGDISELRSSAPVLSGPAEAPEGTTVSIVISNYQSDGISSYEINTCGFGSASISGNTIKWTLGAVDADIAKQIEVVCRRRGELYSDTAIYRVLVKNVLVQNGPTIAFADSVEGYPGATVSNGVISAPAHSVGANNSHQIVSAKPEIVQTSGKLTLLEGTSASSLKSKEKVAQGDIVVTDQSVVTLGKVTEEAISSADVNQPFKDGSCIAFYKFDGDGVDQIGGQNFTTGLTYTSGKYGQAALATPTNTVNVPIDKHSVSFVWTTRSGVAAEDSSLLFISGSYFGPHYGYWYDLAGRRLQDWVDALADGQFHTICAVHSASESRAYVDGVLKYTGPAATTGAGRVFSQIGYGCSSKSMYYDQLRIFNRVLTEAEITKLVTENISSYASDISSGGFTSIPTTAIKADASLKIGAGTVGEYLGPKKELTLKSGSSTKSSIVVTCEESIKDKVFKSGGLHKTVRVDDVEVEVSAVDEATVAAVGGELIPVMTSHRQDGFTISASSEYTGPNYGESFMATTATVGTVGWYSPSEATADWFIEFPEKQKLSKYALWGPNNPTNIHHYQPRTWVLSGLADDGVTWEELDSKTDQPDWSMKELREFPIAPAKAYKKYKMHCSNNKAGSNQMGIGKIQMWDSSSMYETTITPKTDLSKVPTTVAIPDRCTLSPAGYTYAIDGDDLKITGAEITLADDPNLKRLAMAVKGDGVKFKGGKIYIKEKP